MTQALNLKERRFVDAYLGSAGGNGVQAVITAGYTANRKSASVYAVRLLAKAKIQAAIRVRAERATAQSILTAEARDGILSTIAEGPAVDRDRIAAIKELNKCGGRHSIKHVIDGKLTLEQVLTESRK